MSVFRRMDILEMVQLTVPVGVISEEKKKLLEVTEKSLLLGIEQAC